MSVKFKWLDFKITNRCNNACKYCQGHNDSLEAPEKLSFKTIKETLLDALDASFNFFCFLGGEPSIRENIVDIINILKNKRDIHLRLITNLKIFRKEMYEALFETKSIDAEVVASFENFSFPNYKKVDPKLSMIRIEKIKNIADKYQENFNNLKKRAISIHSVISRENFFKIGKFVEYYFDRGIEVTLGLVCPSNFTDNPQYYNDFTKTEILDVMKQLNELEKKGKLCFANEVLRDFLKIYSFGDFSHKKNCWGGKKEIIINSDGEVYPCISESYFSPRKFGNIKDERFSTILQKLQDFKCSMDPHSACWDHFLWDKLAKKLEVDENGKL
ncbi:MAG: radical SAM protein [Candidatus Lokiarchaeota archaeon]|nr:radical SAM protein [Candidatus Lokiarchaeota archaeon]